MFMLNPNHARETPARLFVCSNDALPFTRACGPTARPGAISSEKDDARGMLRSPSDGTGSIAGFVTGAAVHSLAFGYNYSVR